MVGEIIADHVVHRRAAARSRIPQADRLLIRLTDVRVVVDLL